MSTRPPTVGCEGGVARGELLGDFMADLRGAGGTARPDDGR